ncbi:tail fiber domain-containing protein [Neobacillus drentensis]|uniref:tail fiber domain-containing protein n=1 Tax=Neobacillus drentensis TaxID=220684 RepID=UPI002FFD627A
MQRRNFIVNFVMWLLSFTFGYKVGHAKGSDSTTIDVESKELSNSEKISMLNEQLSDIGYNIKQFGAAGDGFTDDSDSIKKADKKDGILLFPPGTYKSEYVPSSLCKGAGATLIIQGNEINLDDKALPVNSIKQGTTILNNTTLGLDAGTKLTAKSYGNTAVGDKALQNNTATVRNTAVGSNALKELEDGYANTAIGIDSLHWAYYSDRNTMIGSTAGKNIGNKKVTGRHRYFKDGEDTAILDAYWPKWRQYAGTISNPTFVPNTPDDTTSNVGVGRNALGFAITPKKNVALGYSALEGGLNAESCVAIGEAALQYGIKSLNSTVIGSRAGYHLMDTTADVIIGKSAAQELVHSEHNVAIGYQAFSGMQFTNKNDKPVRNVAIGSNAMAKANGSFTGNVGVGASTLNVNQGNHNTAIGTGALGFNTTGTSNTAIGYNALNNSNTAAYKNVTGIGANSTVTGSNQVQLGDSATSTYVFGTVQNRSDRRDKADIQDTKLGLDFINALRPVDFKWDYRESYVDVDAEGNEIHHQKDGSRKRNRYHHGLIAQEVKEIIDETGIDFGGFQDHSLNDGGDDVLSIGYDELIPPLIKAVQELTARVKELEKAQKL